MPISQSIPHNERGEDMTVAFRRKADMFLYDNSDHTFKPVPVTPHAKATDEPEPLVGVYTATLADTPREVWTDGAYTAFFKTNGGAGSCVSVVEFSMTNGSDVPSASFSGPLTGTLTVSAGIK